MNIIDLPLGQIIPYARNPRRNEKAIATVAASIAEFGWRQPIVVYEGMVVLAYASGSGAQARAGDGPGACGQGAHRSSSARLQDHGQPLG